MGSTLTHVSRLSATLRLVAVAALVVGAIAAQAALRDTKNHGGRAHGVGIADCDAAIEGPGAKPGKGDIAIGPLVLMGAEGSAGVKPNAFGNNGYKIPATLPRGLRVSLSVPRQLRKEIGLVFTRRKAGRVRSRGVKGADAAIRFIACPATKSTNQSDKGAARSAWAGGIVVDRPRCAVLQLRRRGEDPISVRVPLGRTCPKA